jgi:hypothetical protein
MNLSINTLHTLRLNSKTERDRAEMSLNQYFTAQTVFSVPGIIQLVNAHLTKQEDREFF